MGEKAPHRKIYFGWWTVLATGILSGLGHGFYAQGAQIFFKPIAADLGFSRTVASIAPSITRVEGGIDSPIAGWLVDKFGPKWLMFSGVCLMGIGLILMYFINSLLTYCLIWAGIIATGINMSLSVTVDKALTNWFVRKRGLALGIKFTMLSAGGVVVLQVLPRLIQATDWRITCVICGVIMLAASPLVLLFVKQNRPEYYGLLPDGAGNGPETSNIDTADMLVKGAEYAASFQEREFTLKQAMKTWAFWLLVISQTCFALLGGVVSLHTYNFLTDMNINPVAAAAMLSLQVFFQMPFRFVGGVISDRLSAKHLPLALGAAYLIMAISVVPLLFHQTIPMVYIFLVLFGIGNGLPTTLRIGVISRYFGRKSYGKIYGNINFFTAIVGFAAPIYAGWAYDTTHSYIAVFTQGVILTFVGVIFTCLIRIPRQIE